MPLLFPFFLLISVFLICNGTYGASPGRFSKRVTVKAAYSGKKTKTDSPDIRIFKELAKETLKEPWQVDIHFSAVVSWQVFGKSADSLFIKLDSVKVTGDTLFRKFSIKEVLKPSSFRLSLRIANSTDTTNYSRQVFAADSMPGAPPFSLKVAFNNYDPGVDTILFEGLTFHFTEADWIFFHQRTELIHNYYAASLILDSIQAMARDIHPLAREQLSVNYFKIYEINKALSLISSTSFSEILISDDLDLLRLHDRLRDNYRTGRTLTYTFLDALTGRLPLRGDRLHPSASGWMSLPSERVSLWIDRSQWMDQLQGALYQKFLDQLFEGEPFPEENQATQRWLESLFPGAGKDTLLKYYCNSVYEHFLEKASDCISADDHVRAVGLSEGAQQFARQWNGMTDTLRGTEMLTRANEGVFASFVAIADGCIDRGNQEMAVAFLDKADQFRLAHPVYVVDDAFYREAYSKLYFIRNTHCDKLLEESQFADALNCYEALVIGFPERELVVLAGSLNARMDRAREGMYIETARLTMEAIRDNRSSEVIALNSRAENLRNDMTSGSAKVVDMHQAMAREVALVEMKVLFRQADTAMEKRQFTLAVSLFGRVRVLSDENRFELPEGFDSLFHRSMKQFLLISLSSKQRKIWKNEFDSAGMAAKAILDSMAVYHLEHDEDLINALNLFDKKIQDRKCTLFLDSLSYQMIVASRKTKLKQFIPACQIFREVSLRIAGQPGCAVTGFTPEDSLKKYNDACVYQMTLDSVSTLVVVGKYPEACGTLFRSYQFYKSGNAHLYIPKPLVAERFIEERNNLYLTVAALDQAIAGKNLAKTLFFLQLAKNQQASADQIRKQQETTGAMIATVENENRPVPDQALQLLNSPDRFWKFLQSAYNQHVSELNQR